MVARNLSRPDDLIELGARFGPQEGEPATETLWALVDRDKAELLAICADLIKIPSVYPGQMEAIVDFVCAYLSAAGIEHRIVRAPDNTPGIVAKVGTPGGKVAIFNGHNDVVPVGELARWDYSPYCGTITETEILGRGASDMKCGVGIMLFIAKKMSELQLQLKGELHLHIVHDEENGGLMGTKFLIDEGYSEGAEFCMIPEPTTYSNVEVGQKGSMRAEIVTYGKPVNSSIINYVGENAVHKMVRVLNSLPELTEMKATFGEDEHELLEDSRAVIRKCLGVPGVEQAIDHVNVNIVSVAGGDSMTMTPEVCCAHIGVLAPAMVPMSSVKDRLEAIVARECPKGGTEVRYHRSSDGASTGVDTPLVRSALKHARALWAKKVVAAHQWATSDAKYYRHSGIPTIQYGPANVQGIHAYNECVDQAEILNCAKVYLAVLNDLIGFQDVRD
jgi:succinyl-diaminopimelate desuccinylase